MQSQLLAVVTTLCEDQVGRPTWPLHRRIRRCIIRGRSFFDQPYSTGVMRQLSIELAEDDRKQTSEIGIARGSLGDMVQQFQLGEQARLLKQTALLQPGADAEYGLFVLGGEGRLTGRPRQVESAAEPALAAEWDAQERAKG